MATSRSKPRKQYTEEEKAQFKAKSEARRAETSALADLALSGLAKAPEKWREFLWAAAMHPKRPGVTNIALIAAQAPYELADDFHGWRRKGRPVRRDETSHVRVFTTVIKSESDENGENGEQEEGKLVGFNTGALFTLPQTEPDGGEVSEAPRWTAEQVASACATALKAHGVEVQPDEENARALLGILARKHHAIVWDVSVPVTNNEGESAAYVAAVMLGLPDPGPAPLPQMALTADGKDPYAEIRATAGRVMTLGRRIEALLQLRS